MSPSQRTILEILRTQKIVRSAEIIPPRNGAEVNTIFEQIETLKQVPVDFISVTKGAGGSLRGGTLPIAQVVKERFGICALAHFTCRDYTIEEVENTLMDHHYFGVHNILALRGDPPDGKPDHFQTAPNRHCYAWQLIDQIKKLNQGQYLVREGYDVSHKVRKGQRTQFCIGAAAHPEHEPFHEAVEYLACKAEVGAEYAITQMLFEDTPYLRFVEACRKRGLNLPIIPGLRIVTQLQTAERMIKKFGVKIPPVLLEILSKVKTPEDGRQRGLEYTQKLCKKLLQSGAPGIHVFVMSDAQSAMMLLRNI